MSGEINIKISSLEGEVKALAVAANSDGSDAIDSAYEHSLFTKYLEDAGLDASDFSVKYENGGVRKSETQLVKEQKFKDGSTKEQVANMEQYESAWQQAMKSALEYVGKDPEGRAKLMNFIKTKPKLQNFSSMADYAFALGQKISEMGDLVGKDLKEFATGLVKGAVQDINKHTTKVVLLTAEALSQQLEEGKAEIVKEVKDSEGRTAQLIKAEGNRIVKVIRNAEGNIIKVVQQEGERTREHVDDVSIGIHMHIDDAAGRVMENDNRNTDRIIRNDNRNTARIIRNDNRNTRFLAEHDDYNTQKVLNGQQEQTALSEHSEAITRNLNGDGRFFDTGHKQKTITAFNNMIQKVQNSNLSFEKKNEFLQELEDLSADGFIFDEELRHMDELIEHEINGTPMRSSSERLADIARDIIPGGLFTL